jgi:WD40 repeat protein
MYIVYPKLLAIQRYLLLFSVVCARVGIGLACATAVAVEPSVTAIAFAPDGHSVVVGSQAGLAVLSWPQLKLQKKIDTTLVNVHDLAFSPNGKSLAVAGGSPAEEGFVEVFAWPSGTAPSILNGHHDSVLAVTWRNDSTLATASLDHEIAMWDVTTRQRTLRLRGHSRGVTTLKFLADQKTLVTGGLDQNLRVWDIESAQMLRTLNNHTREIHQIAVRPATSGLPMIASVSDDRTVRIWQPTIGRMVRFAQLQTQPLAVDWLADGSHIAVASIDGHVRLIDPDTVEIVADFPAVAGWAYALAAHPDGTLLVGGQDGQLQRIVPQIPNP